MDNKYIESEIAKALIIFSNGKLTPDQARAKAAEVAPNFDLENEMLAHKGLNWYVKEILKYM